MVNQENIVSSARHSARARVLFPPKAGTLLSCKARETIEKTRVKYLPLEEAVKIKSGTNATTNIKRRNQASLTNAYESHSASFKRRRVVTETASPKGCFLAENTKVSRNSGNSEPHVCGSSHKTAPRQGAIQMSAPFIGEQRHIGCPSQQSFLESSQPNSTRPEDGPDKPSGPAVNAEPKVSDPSQQSFLESSKRNSTKPEDRPGRPDVPAVYAKPRASDPDLNSFLQNKEVKDSVDDKNNQGVNCRKGGCASDCLIDPMVLESNLQDPSPKFQKYSLNCPSVEVVWKGSFEVLDISVDSGLCEGFLAHPPAKVSRKAYDFSKQIAPVLQFKVHPRRRLWDEIYQNECPDGNDIALYFYPGNFERSRRKYAYLLKLIEKHDLVLRSRMNCVELLVFGSKQLHADSQKLNDSFFMWGVFRHLKGQTAT